MDKRKALGRGLGALIPAVTKAVQAPADAEAPAAQIAERPGPPQKPAQREFFLCPIEEIVPSEDNPRRRFDEARMEELATSIRTQGLVQPLVVRLRTPEEQRDGKGASFVLIAGERRWRAAQKASMREVPVVVKDVSAARAFELALVENLQREDLNAIEEAEAYRRLSEEFGYTQEELAGRVGRARETVANSLRLLKLPDRVRQMVARDELQMGHARALLGLDEEDIITRAALQVVDKQLSVRSPAQLVRRAKTQPPEAPMRLPAKAAAVFDVVERVLKALGTRVLLQMKDKAAGKIEVHFHSLDELDGLIDRLERPGR